MKNVIICMLVSLLTLFGACKRCYTCRNECYECGSSQTVYCSSDYNNISAWLSKRDFFIKSCTLIAPTEVRKICDTKDKGLVNIYEVNNFYCGD
jgi:hypothetical protein